MLGDNMASQVNETTKMKVFPKGQVVIPVSLRRRYNIAIGDQIEIIPVHDGIYLKPVLKEKQDDAVTDQLFGIFGKYAKKDKKLKKSDIVKATEKGFNKASIK